VRFWHLARVWIGCFDVIFLERELFDDDTWSMETRFRKMARAFVLDVDDAVFLRHPEKFQRIARMSDLVIAGNRFLKDRIEPMNCNIVIIPTCIDTEVFPLKRYAQSEDRRVIVGWMGTTANLEYLLVVASALRNLAIRCDFELRLIAPDDGPLKSIDLSGVNVRFVTWKGDTEVDELLRIDIGIMPLFAEDDWNAYKCGLKLLQYMAIGVPGVASPIGVNRDIIRHGENGFLASEPDEWEESLLELVQNPDLRRTVGANARRTVEKHYSVQTHLPRLIASLQAVIRREPAAGI